MGDIADYYYDRMLEAEFEKEYYLNTLFEDYDKGNKIWRTKNNKTLSLQEMSDSHLKNSLNMLLSNKADNRIIKIFKTEIMRRKNNYYKTIKKCPNCGYLGFDGDCPDCSFDATEIDIY